MKIDFKKLFPRNTDTEVLDIIRKVSIQQQSENVPDEEIATDVINFLVDHFKLEDSIKVQEYNSIISHNINKLSLNKKWLNLFNVSKHALEESVETKEKSMDNYSLGLKLRYQILNSGLSELKGVFNKEWLKKNYSDIYDKIEKE